MKKIILGIAVLILAAVLVLLLIPVGEIRFEGSAYYSESELKEMIFGDQKPRYYVVRLSEMLGRHREIPFVDHYDLQFGAERSITVRLYERSLAGCLRFQDYYLFFDWSGTVVESGQQKVEGVFEITGLAIDHAVVGEKLPVADSSMIDSILTVSQFLRNEKLRWGEEETLLADLTKSIRFGTEGVQVEVADIKVVLGDDDHMDAKLFLMADILPELYARRGTLYLNQYQPGAVRPHYIFKENQGGE